MFLTYNGIQLNLATYRHDENLVYDPSGVDPLYVHHRLTARSVWNPSATTDGGKVAAESIANLRAKLMTPNALLTFDVPSSGGPVKNVLTSPLKDPAGNLYPCDANNGPKPISLNIVGVIGEKTMIVEFVIETWQKECLANRPILSHRWEMSTSLDENFFTTQTINGLAIFRTDWAQPVGGVRDSPDAFRGYLFHPIPANFKRCPINATLSTDGTALRYTIVDVQQYVNIKDPFANITSIDVNYTEATGAFDYSVVWPALVATGLAGPIAGAWVALGGLPKTRFQVNVRAQGRPTCSLQDMRAATAKILASLNFGDQRIFGAIPIPALFFHSAMESHSLTRPYLETVVIAEVSAGAQALQNTLGFGPAANVPQVDNDVFKWQPDAPGGSTSNPQMSGGAREYCLVMAAQMLKSPCDDPAEVPRHADVPEGVVNAFPA